MWPIPTDPSWPRGPLEGTRIVLAPANDDLAALTEKPIE
jgi:hypothetical protein